MATKRRAPPKKQPSPPPPPPQPAAESSEDEEEEVESDSGKESGEERDGKQSQSQSKASDDDGDRSDEGDDSGEEDSESEPEQPTPNRSQSAAAAVAPTVPAPATPAAASDDDEDEGDESGEADSETEEEQPMPIRPAPRAATTGKLSNENSVTETGKDAATSPKTTTGETAKKSFQRIWSDEDQITLLEGMVDYIATQGKDPIANIEGFWLFIRKKLSFTVTEWQLMGKIRAVKQKYQGNWKKNRTFSRTYDAKVFELSKKVWGAGEKSMAKENGGGKKRKIDKSDKEAEAVENDAKDEVVDDGLEWENEAVSLSKECFDWSDGLARVKIKSVAESERKSFVQRWKKLKAEEMRGLVNRRSLELDTMKTIF